MKLFQLPHFAKISLVKIHCLLFSVFVLALKKNININKIFQVAGMRTPY